MKCAAIAIGVLAGSLLGGAANAGAVCIDDFTTGAFSDTKSLVNNYYAQQAGSMFGGQRDVRYAIVANQFGLSSDVVIGGGMTFSANDPGVKGTVALQYDGSGEAEANGNPDFVLGNGLNADWSGAPSIDIDFLFIDRGFDIRIVLCTYGAGTTVVGESVIEQSVLKAEDPYTESFLLAAATPTVGAGVDLSNVDSLTIYFNDKAVSAVDFGISKIYVPTPGAAGLLAMGGLVAIRRRR